MCTSTFALTEVDVRWGAEMKFHLKEVALRQLLIKQTAHKVIIPYFSSISSDNFQNYYSEREQEREEISRQTKCGGSILKQNALLCLYTKRSIR